MNDFMSGEYFLVYSDARSDSATGLQPKVAIATASQIIARADAELTKLGSSLEALAGIGGMEDEDGDWVWARELSDEEALKFSIEHQATDKLFYAFGVNERDSEGEFLFCAEDHGISEEIAERLLFRWHQARRDSLASN